MKDQNRVEAIVEKAIQEGDLAKEDQTYTMNRLLHILELDEPPKSEDNDGSLSRLELMDGLVADAKKRGVVGDSQAEKEMLEADIMNLFTPLPSGVNKTFWKDYEKSPSKATEYFYGLSRRNNYIQTRAIAKNIEYKTPTNYGDLEITINLSKPEKDPKEIAAAGKATAADYPKCMLCMENEGYEGRLNYPARSNHRIVRMDLTDEKWGFQYSPYAYYNEHCIFLSAVHRPMQINKDTFVRLLEITEQFPHYFVGSNADLPIVGGSILSHDHYQGGRHVFPMEKAEILEEITLSGFSDIRAGIVKWPMSVLRLRSQNKKSLVDAATAILEKWRKYSDLSVDILSQTDGVPHNTITPIARRRGDDFELDLVLRNNRTTDEYPYGIFHPHEELHHIKKENIGLIEVMGLAVLPPRLKEEMKEIEKFLLNKENKMAEYHSEWAETLKRKTANITSKNAKEVVENGVGEAFLKVLEDAGVFKQTESGLAAFQKFSETL